MSETEEFRPPSWLPARSQRALILENGAERAEAARAEKTQAERRAQLEDQALSAYRASAEGRGEVVSAMALATGQAGRTLADILQGAENAADHEAGRQAAQERKSRTDWDYLDAREPVLAGRSSAWPSSEYELDRTISRAEDLHRDLVMYAARHDYPAAEQASRAKSEQRAMIYR